MKPSIFVLFFFGLLLPARVARASEQRTTFALIVTNNRSSRLSRPDLRYADDDGAKYYETFRMIAPGENVVLLTTFDRDSARLFPDMVSLVKPPSKANVDATMRDFSLRVAAAKRDERQKLAHSGRIVKVSDFSAAKLRLRRATYDFLWANRPKRPPPGIADHSE